MVTSSNISKLPVEVVSVSRIPTTCSFKPKIPSNAFNEFAVPRVLLRYGALCKNLLYSSVTCSRFFTVVLSVVKLYNDAAESGLVSDIPNDFATFHIRSCDNPSVALTLLSYMYGNWSIYSLIESNKCPMSFVNLIKSCEFKSSCKYCGIAFDNKFTLLSSYRCAIADCKLYHVVTCGLPGGYKVPFWSCFGHVPSGLYSVPFNW